MAISIPSTTLSNAIAIARPSMTAAETATIATRGIATVRLCVISIPMFSANDAHVPGPRQRERT